MCKVSSQRQGHGCLEGNVGVGGGAKTLPHPQTNHGWGSREVSWLRPFCLRPRPFQSSLGPLQKFLKGPPAKNDCSPLGWEESRATKTEPRWPCEAALSCPGQGAELGRRDIGALLLRKGRCLKQTQPPCGHVPQPGRKPGHLPGPAGLAPQQGTHKPGLRGLRGFVSPARPRSEI